MDLLGSCLAFCRSHRIAGEHHISVLKGLNFYSGSLLVAAYVVGHFGGEHTLIISITFSKE